MTNLTVAQLFDQLNTFRTRNGKQPLKSFKGSRAQILDLLNKEANDKAFEATPEELAAQTVRPADTTTAATIAPKTDRADTSTDGTKKANSAELKAARLEQERLQAALAAKEAEQPSTSSEKPKPAPKAKPAKAAPKAAKAKAAKAGFSAAAIIAEFGIAPKVGRQLLRKHNVDRTPEAIRAFFKARAK